MQGTYESLWNARNWCFGTVVLEKTIESLLDSKEIKPVNSKGNQPWRFIGKTDVETKAPILWPSHVKSWLIAKDPDTGKDWGQEKGVTEDKMVGWHHQFNEHEFEQTLGDSEGRETWCAVCNSWGHRVEHDWAIEQTTNKIQNYLLNSRNNFIKTWPCNIKSQPWPQE